MCASGDQLCAFVLVGLQMKHKIKQQNNQSTSKRNLRIGSWNISTMRGKSLELEQMMKRRRLDILTVQEMKWKNSANKARWLDSRTKAYRLFFAGEENHKNGVGIIVAKELLRNIVSITKVSDRLMSIKIVINCEIWNIVSSYAPQINLGPLEKQKSWTDYSELTSKFEPGEIEFHSGDLNVHVGESNNSYEECHAGFGIGSRNESGEDILNFCMARGLIKLNTMFEKETKHLVTYTSGAADTQIDYHLSPKTCAE